MQPIAGHAFAGEYSSALKSCIRARSSLMALVLSVVAWTPALTLGQRPVQRQPDPQAREPSVPGIPWSEKPTRAGSAAKISNRLHDTIAELRGRGADRHAVLANRPESLSSPLQRIDSQARVQCYIHYTAKPDSIARAVEATGGTVELISPELRVVQARVPYDAFEALAAIDSVANVRLPGYALPRSGSLLSQGDAAHRSDLVRSTKGWTGTGIKVGVISDGINGIALSQASGDIPAVYEALSARSDGNLLAGAEGTAMMEIVHDLAPGAALAFSNPGTSAEMVSAIHILDSTFHCNVICDDLGFADDPWFADGAIVSRINQAVAGGAIYVSAAGNDADKNYYEAPFTGMSKRIKNINMQVQNYGANDWSMQAYVQGNGGWLVVILQWNDAWGASANDYDLFLTDSSGNTIYAASQDTQNGNDYPIEAVQYVNNSANGTNVQVVVRRYSGANRQIKLVSWGYGWFTEYSTPTGSIYGHPAGENVIACGAIRATNPANVENFSSRGPVRIDFPSLSYRQKPDICGANGVSVTGNGGFPTMFYGTSAAAPHVAAVCAQIWGAQPTLTNTDVRNLLQNTAIDLGTPGFDTVSGFGRADAFNAVNAIFFAPIPGDFDSDGDVDEADVATFTTCRTPPDTLHDSTPACQAADFDGDGDVDQEDFGTLQNCLSGADVPGDPACAQAP